MVAALMLSDLLSHVSFPVNVTLPSPLQSSTRKPLTDDALHYHLIEAAGALAHLAPEERHMYSTRDKQTHLSPSCFESRSYRGGATCGNCLNQDTQD